MSASILVVEDEPAIQELLRVTLQDAGFAVHAVPDAESAQARIKAKLPDLVLL
ncbi:MAG: response regulator, partial [Casimicrobiaceae bacterium]